MIKMLRQQFGFTLVEILIAVGILAGTIAAIMPVVEVASMLSVEDEKLLQAVTLANNKMVELEMEIETDLARGKFPDEEERAGYFDEPFGDFKWEYSIRKVEIPLGQGGDEQEGQNVVVAGALKNIMKEISKAVRELKVKVEWGDEDRPKDFSITTHVVNIR